MAKKMAYVAPMMAGAGSFLIAGDETWTWSAFADAVVSGATSGAAGGAVASAIIGDPGLIAGAAVGGLAGAVGGASAYAATSAYHALVGNPSL